MVWLSKLISSSVSFVKTKPSGRVLTNYINGQKDINEWGKLTEEQQQGIVDAIDEIDHGKGIPHEKIMEDIRKKDQLTLQKNGI